MDQSIERMIKACPLGLRGKAGELTEEELRRFCLLSRGDLINQLHRICPGFAIKNVAIDPTHNNILYEDDQPRTVSLRGLGYRLVKVGDKSYWSPNNSRIYGAPSYT